MKSTEKKHGACSCTSTIYNRRSTVPPHHGWHDRWMKGVRCASTMTRFILCPVWRDKGVTLPVLILLPFYSHSLLVTATTYNTEYSIQLVIYVNRRTISDVDLPVYPCSSLKAWSQVPYWGRGHYCQHRPRTAVMYGKFSNLLCQP